MSPGAASPGKRGLKDYSKPNPKRKLKTLMTFILIIVMIWASGAETEVSFSEFVQGFPHIMELLREMFPPSWGYFDNILQPMLETVRMAIIGTTLGGIIAVPIILCSSQNVATNPFIHYPARFILNLIRTIPELLLAALFVPIVGIGEVAGILAITVFSLGVIAKLAYEAVEAIDNGPLEAMTAVGANKIKLIMFGVVPQVFPAFMSYFLYSLEINVRAAAILGYVGAGGIGLYLKNTLSFFQYDSTLTIIIATLLVVVIIDALSNAIRSQLIEGSAEKGVKRRFRKKNKHPEAAAALALGGSMPLKKSPVKKWTIGLIVAAIYVWSFWSVIFSVEIQDQAGAVAWRITKGLFHPDWSYIPGEEGLLVGLMDTLAIAVLGTFISAILCLPFAFWAARNLSKWKPVSTSGKFVLSVIRVFPELIMALIFIKAVGLGAFAGILALGFHSVGMLGKLFAESIENKSLGAREALTASGANKVQTLFYAIIPEVLPEFMSYTLYRFEISVRAATILGVVGAGGIGTPLIFALEGHTWPRVGIILLGIIVMVTIIDLISGFIRRRLV